MSLLFASINGELCNFTSPFAGELMGEGAFWLPLPAKEGAGPVSGAAWPDSNSESCIRSRVGREVKITLGRLQGAGKRATPDIADYVQPWPVLTTRREAATRARLR
jgi:hypothetical protein